MSAMTLINDDKVAFNITMSIINFIKTTPEPSQLQWFWGCAIIFSNHAGVAQW